MKVILISFALFYFGNLAFAQELKIIKVPEAMRTESTIVVDGVTTHTYSAGKTIPDNAYERKMPIRQLMDGMTF